MRIRALLSWDKTMRMDVTKFGIRNSEFGIMGTGGEIGITGNRLSEAVIRCFETRQSIGKFHLPVRAIPNYEFRIPN
jgi:hypothetical protein